MAPSYPRVSFDVDHIDDALGEGWSVLVSGDARLATGPAELERSLPSGSARGQAASATPTSGSRPARLPAAGFAPASEDKSTQGKKTTTRKVR